MSRLHSESSEPTIFFLKRCLTNAPDATAYSMASSHHLTHPRRVQLVWRSLCDVLFPSCLIKHGLPDAPLLIVSFPSHLSCTLYSSVSLEGLTLSSSALPRVLPPSLPPSRETVSLPPPFPASLPLPCLASSLLLLLPPVHSPSLLHPGGLGRVAKQATGMSFPFD